MSNFNISLISEMASNIKNCPSERCGACNHSIEIIHKSISDINDNCHEIEAILRKALKLLDHHLNCKGADHFYDNEFNIYKFLESRSVKDYLRENKS